MAVPWRNTQFNEIPKWQTRREAGTQSHGSHEDRQTAEDFLFLAVCALIAKEDTASKKANLSTFPT
jgi:hypothetical protein